MDLTEVEILRGSKNTKKLYKKGLNDPDNQDSVITHLASEILKHEVKWALGSITRNKVSGGDAISMSYFKS